MFVPLIAAAAALTAVNVPETLGGHLDRAVERSGIAVLVPDQIATEFKKVYPSSLNVPEGRYILTLGASKNCTGASVCGIANFYAVEGDKLRNGGVKVKLAKGRSGRYFKSRCGANCSFPMITWRQKKVVYTFEYKEAGGRGDMVGIANQAIRAGAR